MGLPQGPEKVLAGTGHFNPGFLRAHSHFRLLHRISSVHLFSFLSHVESTHTLSRRRHFRPGLTSALLLSARVRDPLFRVGLSGFMPLCGANARIESRLLAGGYTGDATGHEPIAVWGDFSCGAGSCGVFVPVV